MPPQEIHPPLSSTGPVTPIVPQMPPPKSNKNAITLAVVFVIIIILLVGIYMFFHRPSAQSALQQASTASSSTPPGSMSGALAPSTSNPALTTYTGAGDTFFTFSYPSSLALNQYPSGIALIAATTSPITAGLAPDANREFDVYLSGDTEQQVRQSVILATTTKVMDAPTDGYTTYDLVLPHIMYHIIDLYTEQGHELDLVTLGSYDTTTMSPQTWVNAYKTIAGSISIDPKKLAQFIADAKARGADAAAQAASGATVKTQ